MNEKPKRKNDSKLTYKQKIGLCFISIGIGFLALLWFISTANKVVHAEGEEAIEIIEDIMNSPLPDSAHDVYVAYVTEPNLVMKVRFSASSGVRFPLVDNSGLTCAGYTYEEVSDFNTNLPVVDWWQPSADSSTSMCWFNPLYIMFYDTTDSENWIIHVYAEWDA